MPARWPRPIRRSLRSRLSSSIIWPRPQAAAEKAEAERKAAEEARKAAEEAALAASKYAASFELAQLLHESETLTGHAREDYAKVIEDAKAAIEAAKTPEEVDEILAAAREALKTAGCPSTNFTDVEENGWYHTGVDFMVRNGFMNGVADDAFDVDGNLTRAQLVTILYRIAGEPESTATNPFGRRGGRSVVHERCHLGSGERHRQGREHHDVRPERPDHP